MPKFTFWNYTLTKSSSHNTIAFNFKYFFFSLEKYIYVGRLLKPGEQPTNYSDEDDDVDKETAAATNKTEDQKPKEEWPTTQFNNLNVKESSATSATYNNYIYDNENIHFDNHHLCDLFDF